MRIEVCSQEMTNEVELKQMRAAGRTYSAVEFLLHCSPMSHHPPRDDDRGAVAFWLPESPAHREALALAFERAAHLIRTAPHEAD